MKIGIIATDSAMRGSSAMTCGVIDAPTATPRIVRAATDTCPNPFSGKCANAPARQKASGPNKNGSGKASDQNNAVPIAARPKVNARRAWG
ncbi:hypothetical protein GCM10022290_45710 [Sagittula marina]